MARRAPALGYANPPRWCKKQVVKLIQIAETKQELNRWQVEQLEAGNILFFPRTPTAPSEEDYRFLLSQRQSGASYYKNIAYRPWEDRVTGMARGGDRDQLHRILKNYCRETAELLSRLAPRYASNWRVDYTSFRPFEEAGRNLSVHARNDLLHIDAFPTRPTNGDRILRFFTNLNPAQPRVWLTTDTFETLAEQFAGAAGLLDVARRGASGWRRALAGMARRVHLRQLAASPYDGMMHRFHNFLKENREFQQNCRKERVEFPPRSGWLVFTDMVSHAVLAGQYALEQTFIVSRRAQERPELAPASILERLAGVAVTWQG